MLTLYLALCGGAFSIKLTTEAREERKSEFCKGNEEAGGYCSESGCARAKGDSDDYDGDVVVVVVAVVVVGELGHDGIHNQTPPHQG